MTRIETARLRLRQWSDADREPLARLNADVDVMRYFPAPLTREQSDGMLERMRAQIDTAGWGFWAAERIDDGELLGVVGLIPVKSVPEAMPGVEVGWRFAKAHWKSGYASEGARAAVAFGHERLGLDEIVSFTAQLNRPSQVVMERLGMRRVRAFEHANVPVGHALRQHWLYALRREDWARMPYRAAEFECGPYRARELRRDELPALQRFYEENPDYFIRVEGAPPAHGAACRDFDQWVPAGWACGGKHVIAFRDERGAIVAMADVLFDLFAPGVWHVGLFLVAERLHGTGAARSLYDRLEAWMAAHGARWSRLGVVRGNARAERFWEARGYVEVLERRDYSLRTKTHTLRVMAKPLAGGTFAEYRSLVPRDRAADAALEST